MPALDEVFAEARGGLVDSRAVSESARRGVERMFMAGVLIPLPGGLVEPVELNEDSCVVTITDSVGGAERNTGESWTAVLVDRTAGDVAKRAISRPSSVMRPWSSVRLSLIVPRSASDGLALSCSCSFSLVRSFSLSTSQRSTSPMRSSRARTWDTVQRSSFSKRLAMVNSVPERSRVPEGVKDAYMGGCSRAGVPPGDVPRWSEMGERLMGCDAGAGDNLTGVLSGVGDVGEADAREVEPLGGMLRLR